MNLADALKLLGDALPDVGTLARLLVAALIGGVLGFDRERKDKPAGLRTHMLVSLGSATFVLLGFEMSAEFSEHGQPALDPTRVLQGVVGGIGFLGAGSIIQARGQVSGVTTAASVWMAGALGSAAGMGAHAIALAATLLAVLVLTALRRLELSLRPSAPGRDSEDSDPDLRGTPTHKPKAEPS
ncbi:MAG TPA: MgtC/SapB family protein [Polyangiaceae bacterium]|nr:MgtC/SapB family protein [Polyangiaceae bacterium]